MQLDRARCYFCDSVEGEVWGEEGGYQALKCTSCGLVYVNPRPPLNAIDEAAKVGEHSTESGSLVVTGHFRRSRVRDARRLLKSACVDLREVANLRWLDIGAGFGELVVAVQSVWPTGVVVGVEPNRTKRAVGTRHGARYIGETLEDAPLGDFDVISLIDVWSHLPDPGSFLVTLAGSLKEGSRILIQTGNGGELPSADMYPDALLLPDHLSFAGESHVVGLLERAGFRIEAVERRRVDTVRFASLRFVKRVLGRPSKLVIPYRSPFCSLVIRARLERMPNGA